MRILLAGSPFLGEGTYHEIDCYLARGMTVVANLYFVPASISHLVQKHYEANSSVSFESFDPSNEDMLIGVICKGGVGFDAMIYPPDLKALPGEIVRTAALSNSLLRRLRAIGCPNDSIVNLVANAELAANCGVAIIHTPHVHARSVAEYTVTQFGFHARRLEDFYHRTGRNGDWPHLEALSSTHTLYGKTLGVIGGSGKDGKAVITLARRYGMQVLAINSGRAEGVRSIRALGAEVARDITDLLTRSDFISVNCRVTERTRGLLGATQIERMKPGVILINASAAEIFDKMALMTEFAKPLAERRIVALVLDMPFGQQRDADAFRIDPDNAELKRRGVMFTPRMAGYTVESQCQAAADLARYLDAYLRLHDCGVPIANYRSDVRNQRLADDSELGQLFQDILVVVREAANEAIRLRDAGLVIHYKPDGSPTTNADMAAEAIIRDGLRECGHAFVFSGEESCEAPQNADVRQIIIDGIDGTRNYRDGNYGWCVSVASLNAGEAELGVIYDPCTRVSYAAINGRGAAIMRDDVETRLTAPSILPPDFSFSVGSFRISGSSRVKMTIIEDIKRLGGREREWGSVALSICAVARGGLGVFIQGNSQLHDHAAAVLIAREAGAHVAIEPSATTDGVDIIACHPTFFDQIKNIFTTRTGEAWKERQGDS